MAGSLACSDQMEEAQLTTMITPSRSRKDHVEFLVTSPAGSLVDVRSGRWGWAAEER